MNRGVEQRDIYLDDGDRRAFIDLLAEAVPEFRWLLHTYALMNNHFHFLIETPQATLSDGMKAIQEAYAKAFNKKHKRVGHLFQGRFRSHLIDTETYVLNVARYIALNPVRANLTNTPGDWRWSSYRAIAGVAAVPEWLTTTSLLNRFDPTDHRRARVEYCRFVGDAKAGADRPFDQLVGGLCLGSTDFVARVKEQIRRTTASRPITASSPATIDDVREAIRLMTGNGVARSDSPTARMLFAEVARSETRAKVKEIGAVLGIGPTAVRDLIGKSRRRSQFDADYAQLVDSLRLQIRNCRN